SVARTRRSSRKGARARRARSRVGGRCIASSWRHGWHLWLAGGAEGEVSGVAAASVPSATAALAAIGENADRMEPAWGVSLRKVEGLSVNRAACQLANRSG